ncbi:MAG: glycosyltransferase family 39 protein [Candidatus Hydrogenedentes bacterium]|nr:glycosyltransferase family 39 protein [Candidatus Hydrogenedentota bacterium]
MIPVKYQLPALLALAMVLFSANIGGYDLWPEDQPRFGEVAREMLQSGDGLVLRVNGQPYREKPPLLFWLIALVSRPFGDVTEFTARVPVVVAGAITVAMTYLLAARLYGPRVAFWAALLLMTNWRFWWQARSVQTDMILTACLAGFLYAFWRRHETKDIKWLIAMYACVTAALYAKGPPGLVFALLLVFAFYWKQPEERRATHPWIGTAVAVLGIGLWFIPAYLAQSSGPPEAAETAAAANVFRQTIGRFFLGVSKAQPPWYYLGTLPMDWLPWSLFLPWTLPWVWQRRREGKAMRLLLCWTLPAFVFFSISIGKRALYLLPISPALAILIARSLLDLMEVDRTTLRVRTAATWGILLTVLAVLPVAIQVKYPLDWNLALVAFSLCALVMAAYMLFRTGTTDMSRLPTAVAGQVCILTLLCAYGMFPAINPHKSARYFCEPLRKLSDAGQSYRLYSLGFSREEYVFYSKHFHTPVLTDLLEVPGIPGLTPTQMARQQREIREVITRAVEEVPIEALAAVNDEELRRLQTALHTAVKKKDVRDHVAQAIERAFEHAIGSFAAEFERPDPAFLFVQEEDWRWILALHPRVRNYRLIHVKQVGRREVLLLANESGAKLYSPP